VKKILLSGVALLMLTCCGYQVHDYLPTNITAIHIPLFANSTDRYGLEERITEEVIKRFLVDGTLKVEGKASSQAVLESTITRHMLIPLVYDVNNLVEEYKMVVTLRLRLLDLASREVIWEEAEADAVEVFYTTYSKEAVNRNSAQSEEEVMEKLVLRTADKVVERTVRGWWVEEQF